MFGSLLCLFFALFGATHPGSLSFSKIEVDGPAVEHVLRVQALSLIEVLPIDANGDLFLDQAEFDVAKESIALYLGTCYDLRANGDADPLERELVDLALDDKDAGGLPTAIWVEARIVAEHSSAITSLEVDERLFETSEPSHKEIVSIAWAGQVATKTIFYPETPTQSFEPSGEVQKSSVRLFFELGIGHILTGYDHLLFLLALFVAVRGLRALALMVTAFTVAHSVTLAMAALDVVSLPPRFVELAIALSIVYVAVENILGWTNRNLWAEALGFGLLHGLGFAGFLRDALAEEEAILMPLVGFNLGVEAGQLAAVLPCAVLCALLFKRKAPEEGSDEAKPLLVPAMVGRALSVPIALAGLYWFLERAGFLPG